VEVPTNLENRNYFRPDVLDGAISIERERGSLDLLVITGLSPWEILLQKYASGLVAGVSLILIGLPLSALAFSLGGLAATSVITASLALGLSAIQAGGIALLASLICRRTVVALAVAYLVQIPSFLAGSYSGNPVFLFFEQRDDLGAFLGRAPFTLVVPVLCLVCCRLVWNRSNTKPTRPEVDVSNEARQANPLPRNRPFAWRERRKLRAWFAGSGWISLVLVELVVVATSISVSFFLDKEDAVRMLSALHLGIWVLIWLVVTVFGVNLFEDERASQTLDLLRMTPQSGWDILSQKTEVIRDILAVAVIPALTVAIFAGSLSGMWIAGGFLVSSASTIVFILLTFWVAVPIGLIVESHYKSILYALGPLLAHSL
jgi:ABC-type transport system involved in multi-copper enzyme maturation permease subunit